MAIRAVRQVDACGGPCGKLGSHVGRLAQKKRLPAAVAAVVDGERLACIDANPHNGVRNIFVLVAGEGKGIDDQLGSGHGAVDPSGFAVVAVRLGDQRVKSLVMEVDPAHVAG